MLGGWFQTLWLDKNCSYLIVLFVCALQGKILDISSKPLMEVIMGGDNEEKKEEYDTIPVIFLLFYNSWN